MLESRKDMKIRELENQALIRIFLKKKKKKKEFQKERKKEVNYQRNRKNVSKSGNLDFNLKISVSA